MNILKAHIAREVVSRAAQDVVNMAAVDANSMFSDSVKVIMNFVSVGGGLWAVWGVVAFGLALDDHNGNDMKRGMFKIIGGVMVIVASQLFSRLAL